jgi:nickel-dependent lactate racemase
MLKIPYGKTCIPFEEGGAAVLTSRIGELKAGGDGLEIVRAAMEKPIDSPRLSELARGKKNCVIIISDHTRPVPSRDILPNMFAELREGSPDIDITLLVATGFHRPTCEAELRAKLGDEIYEQSRIVIHDCRDADANVQVGVLPSGAPCVIDRTAAEAELLIAEGFIEPHFFAGFSGGRKSVLPGVCDQVTVMGNHCSRFIDSEFARTGILDGNPMHEDMLAAAALAKLAYVVNVVIDEDKRTVAAFAGNYVTAHRAGCDFLLSYARVKPAYADIVLTSNGGAPLDQNLYQCVKSMTAAEASCRPGGVIIECAECADGHGGQSFYESLRDCGSAEALYAQFMATPQEETIADQWESQILARILKKHTVIMVTRPELKTLVEEMKMRYASSPEEALAMARAMGKQSLTVIPNGISVIVRE